ncbi:hypothetical protein CEB3_c26780 [Peptococcaceae bacterium CEB3]|nr:hypothetical protein CEB3_c26780 [Peptococcaceae bacterium CEB3]
MINILNLPEYEVLKVQESNDAYRIEAEAINPPLACTQCGCRANVYRHSRHQQLVIDLPKILFTEGVPRALKQRPVYRRQDFRSDSLFSMILREDAGLYGAPKKYLGADISTLIRLLEGGKV